MIVEERNMETNEYNKTIRSLEDRAVRAGNEGDSLLLALSSTMPDKFGTDSEKPSSTSIAKNVPWTTVKPKSVQDEECQIVAKIKNANSEKLNEISTHNLPVHHPNRFLTLRDHNEEASNDTSPRLRDKLHQEMERVLTPETRQ